MCYKDLTGYISVLIFLLILSFFPTPFFTYPIPIFIYLCIKYNFFSYFENTFKSIIEKLEAANKQKKKKIIFTQHLTTWRKLLSVNIPFPVF